MADAHGPEGSAGIWGSSARDINPRVWNSLGAALLRMPTGDLLSPAPLPGPGPSEHPPEPFWAPKVEPLQGRARLGALAPLLPLASCPSSGTASHGSSGRAWRWALGQSCWAGGAAASPQGIQNPRLPVSREWGPQDRGNWVLHPWKGSGEGNLLHGQCVLRSSPSWGSRAQLLSHRARSRGLRCLTQPQLPLAGGSCSGAAHGTGVWVCKLAQAARGTGGVPTPGTFKS